MHHTVKDVFAVLLSCVREKNPYYFTFVREYLTNVLLAYTVNHSLMNKFGSVEDSCHLLENKHFYK